MPQSESEHESPRRAPSPVLVAIAGWLVPGCGYWMIGERARGMVVGITIIILFTAGTLIGGVRAIQVPSYGEEGGRLYIVREDKGKNDKGQPITIYRVIEHLPGAAQPSSVWVGSHPPALLADVGNKPWSICQALAGPIAIAGGVASVWSARPSDGADGAPPGTLSHSRVNEIAVLYTAVAGMLNLLVMIDAAARASRLQREARSSGVPA